MSRIRCVIVRDFKRPERASAERFTGVAAANLDDYTSRISAAHEDTSPVNKSSLLGTAFIVEVPEGDNLIFHVAVDLARPGDVIVIDVSGDTRRSIFGELMATYCRKRGINGIVVDRSIRDVGATGVLDDFAVYACGVAPDGPYRNGPGEMNTPTACGGRTVYPGDIVPGDEDGAVLVRPGETEELLKRVDALYANELRILDTIEKEGTYIRPQVDEKIKSLGVGYAECTEYIQYMEYMGLQDRGNLNWSIEGNMMFATAVNELMLLFLFLLAGVVLRFVAKPLRKLHLPSGLIGGALALILGPQVLGIIKIPENWPDIALPMINIVLTTTLFGISISISKMKSFTGAISSNLLSYLSQLAVGVLAALGLQRIRTGLPREWGVMIVFTYWGRYGTATSSGTLFEELGVEGMLSIGLILATLGLVVAMMVEMVWVNIGVRRGWARALCNAKNRGNDRKSDYIPREKQKPLGHATVASDSINGLAMQICFMFLSMQIGSVLFGLITKMIPTVSNIPSLLYGIVGAIIVWSVLRKTHLDPYADKDTIDNIGEVVLEICICSATAILDLNFFTNNLAPIMIHMLMTIVLMSFVYMVLMRRWFGENWFPLALMFFGAGCGSIPSGLILARCVDPDVKTESWEAFGAAWGCFMPVTSTLVAILPVIAVNNLWILVRIGAVISTAMIVFNELVVRKRQTARV